MLAGLQWIIQFIQEQIIKVMAVEEIKDKEMLDQDLVDQVAQQKWEGMRRACAVERGIVKKSQNSAKLCVECGGWSGKVAQVIHPTSGLRYCKQCMKELFSADKSDAPVASTAGTLVSTEGQNGFRSRKRKDLGAFARAAHEHLAKRRSQESRACFYCFAVTDDVLQRDCGWAGHSETTSFRMCDACVSEHGVPLCPSC